LLDACVPRQLARELRGHEVRSVVEMGWGDLDDGPLLDAVASHCDALVTVDKSLPKQQSLSRRPFAVVVLRARRNRLTDLVPLVPRLLEALPEMEPGEVRELTA
jgi:hypothetical protein